MAGVATFAPLDLPAAALVAGGLYRYLLSARADHALAVMPWIAFSCYSIPPVRLKKRGVSRVLADARCAYFYQPVHRSEYELLYR